MEAFFAEHIRSRTSFAIETTLRSGITFEQTKAAQAAGFRVEMLYIALSDFRPHLKRVTARAFAGGHSAPADRLRGIHQSSLANLAEAIQIVDAIQVFDNSGIGVEPLLLLEALSGRIHYLAETVPMLADALGGTAYELQR